MPLLRQLYQSLRCNVRIECGIETAAGEGHHILGVFQWAEGVAAQFASLCIAYDRREGCASQERNYHQNLWNGNRLCGFGAWIAWNSAALPLQEWTEIEVTCAAAKSLENIELWTDSNFISGFSMNITTWIVTQSASSNKFLKPVVVCRTITLFCRTSMSAISRKSIVSRRIIVGWAIRTLPDGPLSRSNYFVDIYSRFQTISMKVAMNLRAIAPRIVIPLRSISLQTKWIIAGTSFERQITPSIHSSKFCLVLRSCDFIAFNFSDDLDDKTSVVHFSNANQVFRKQRRDALTNVIYLAGARAGAIPSKWLKC